MFNFASVTAKISIENSFLISEMFSRICSGKICRTLSKLQQEKGFWLQQQSRELLLFCGEGSTKSLLTLLLKGREEIK